VNGDTAKSAAQFVIHKSPTKKHKKERKKSQPIQTETPQDP